MNKLTKGARITALGSKTRRLAVNFPGWGDPNYANYLMSVPAGLIGEVTSVESHGSNPWTRYSVRFTDGTTASGMCLGTDIDPAPEHDYRIATRGGRFGEEYRLECCCGKKRQRWVAGIGAIERQADNHRREVRREQDNAR